MVRRRRRPIQRARVRNEEKKEKEVKKKLEQREDLCKKEIVKFREVRPGRMLLNQINYKIVMCHRSGIVYFLKF